MHTHMGTAAHRRGARGITILDFDRHRREDSTTMARLHTTRQTWTRRLMVGAVGGALIAGLAAAPAAHAGQYSSPIYPTLKQCNAARPTYVSSWTSPQQCWPMYNNAGTVVVGYAFLVKTRY